MQLITSTFSGIQAHFFVAILLKIPVAVYHSIAIYSYISKLSIIRTSIIRNSLVLVSLYSF